MLDAEQKMKLLISDRPWEHEPDNEEWVDEESGYKCTIWRHPTQGHLNGYVALPKGHPLHGQDYNEINNFVETHGGLTYAELDGKTGEWVIGFDCGHHDDFAPKLVELILKYSSQEDVEREMAKFGKYRDWAYVKNEVVFLAQQLNFRSLERGVNDGNEEKS